MAETAMSCGCRDPITGATCYKSVDHLGEPGGTHCEAGKDGTGEEWPVDYEADVEARKAQFRRIGRPNLAELFPELVELYDGVE